MKPKAVGKRHQEEGKRDTKEDPEPEASMVGDSFQVGQKKGDKKNGDDNREREAIRDHHATDVVALLAEEGKAAARALREDFIRPAREQASLPAVGAAHTARIANDDTKGQGACFVHLDRPDCSSIPPSLMSSTRMWCFSNSHAG
jgi:hypothetical protein